MKGRGENGRICCQHHLTGPVNMAKKFSFFFSSFSLIDFHAGTLETSFVMELHARGWCKRHLFITPHLISHKNPLSIFTCLQKNSLKLRQKFSLVENPTNSLKIGKMKFQATFIILLVALLVIQLQLDEVEGGSSSSRKHGGRKNGRGLGGHGGSPPHAQVNFFDCL